MLVFGGFALEGESDPLVDETTKELILRPQG